MIGLRKKGVGKDQLDNLYAVIAAWLPHDALKAEYRRRALADSDKAPDFVDKHP